MKKSLLVFTFFAALQFEANAQKSLKPKLTSINQFGIVWGAAGHAWQLQTINGLSYKTYSAGIGIGLDYYWERTVPIFIDVRKYIFPGKKTPFVYADLGISMPWIKTNKEVTWYKSDYANGEYYDIGIGYRIPIKNKLFGNISLGYSQKWLREERTNEMVIFDFSPYGPNSTEHYNYTLRRFSLKAGLSF